MPCPRCSGSGLCPDCSGQGNQECPVCSGQGRMETSRGVSYVCKSCAGEKTIPCPVECSSCEGKGEITEQLQKQVRDRKSLRFENLSPVEQTTRLLIACNVAVFLATLAFPNLLPLMVLYGGMFQQGEPWRLISFLFQHTGWLHLLANMAFLWSFGPTLEGILGRARFLTVYLGGGVLAGLFSWAAHTAIDGQAWAATGASASLFALTGAYLALYWRWRLLPWELVRSLGTWSAMIMVFGFATEGMGFGFLDNWSHLGGLLAGLLVAVMPRPRGH